MARSKFRTSISQLFSVVLLQAPVLTLPQIRGPGTNVGGSATEVRDTFNLIISFLVAFFTLLGAIFFIFQMFIGAFAWLNAGDNQNNLTAAKQKILQALIGLTIVVASYAIIALAAELLQLNILSPLDCFVPIGAPC